MNNWTLLNCVVLSVGGAMGTLARFGIGEWFKSQKLTDSFPWHTFAINIAGSLILGVVVVFCKERPTLALCLGTGFCGGLTTFSTFCLEGHQMISEHRYGWATAYLLGSLFAGLLGIAIAMWLTYYFFSGINARQ